MLGGWPTWTCIRPFGVSRSCLRSACLSPSRLDVARPLRPSALAQPQLSETRHAASAPSRRSSPRLCIRPPWRSGPRRPCWPSPLGRQWVATRSRRTPPRLTWASTACTCTPTGLASAPQELPRSGTAWPTARCCHCSSSSYVRSQICTRPFITRITSTSPCLRHPSCPFRAPHPSSLACRSPRLGCARPRTLLLASLSRLETHSPSKSSPPHMPPALRCCCCRRWLGRCPGHRYPGSLCFPSSLSSNSYGFALHVRQASGLMALPVSRRQIYYPLALAR
mmetsp:Transcript_12176/g.37318  ORF Transcript_12176/g.37318 Transcript_12176/m.37318 type:complete len:280 (+) Transcript_12176:832-1671(+)